MFDTCNTTLTLSPTHKTATAEVTCDLSLPDYCPEVRRLLSVRAIPAPADGFMSGGKTEFSGSVSFCALYEAPDGGLYTARGEEPYALTVTAEHMEGADPAVARCDVFEESVTGRVTAPRRLVLRCRVRGDVSLLATRPLSEQVFGRLSDPERLPGEAVCALPLPRVREDMTLREDIPESGRPIDGTATVHITEARPFDGGVSCRGEICLRVLVAAETENSESDENGASALPRSVSRQVPFSLTVPADGFKEGMGCLVTGHCRELSFEDGPEGCVAVIAVTLMADAHHNIPVHYTADIYGVGQACSAEYADLHYAVAGPVVSGNFTQSIYEPPASFGLAEDCVAVDVSARGRVTGAEGRRGHTVLTGDTEVTLLLRGSEGYFCHRLTLPFRYEAVGEAGELAELCGNVIMLAGRCRVEGGRLGVELEMAVSATPLSEAALRAVTAVRAGDPLPASHELVVAFPAPDEPLWQLAKRYAVPFAPLAAAYPANPSGAVVVSE